MRFQTLFEARWIFAVLIILSALSLLLTSWLWLLFLLLIGYTFFFFRDPERIVPVEPDVVASALSLMTVKPSACSWAARTASAISTSVGR